MLDMRQFAHGMPDCSPSHCILVLERGELPLDSEVAHLDLAGPTGITSAKGHYCGECAQQRGICWAKSPRGIWKLEFGRGIRGEKMVYVCTVL
jgi:hypothetical protein